MGDVTLRPGLTALLLHLDVEGADEVGNDSRLADPHRQSRPHWFDVAVTVTLTPTPGAPEITADPWLEPVSGTGFVLVPDARDRQVIDHVIYHELVRGEIRSDSRSTYLEIIDRLVARGARGVIAGCTEIELLVGPDDVSCAYFPTTYLHAMAVVEASLAP